MGEDAEPAIASAAELPRLRAELAALSTEVQRLRALVAAVPDLIIRLHRDGTYLDFVGAKDIPVLISRSERIGRHVRDVLPKEVADAYLLATAAAQNTSQTQTFRYQLPIGGKTGHYEARVVPSGPDEVLMVVRDVTTQHLAEEALRVEKECSEQILLNILPRPIVDELKRASGSISHRFESATVLFADIVGFTAAAASLPPAAVVETLNEIFTSFDSIAERWDLEKIKTIGDAYMVVGGVPIARPNHAESIAEMALSMQEKICDFSFPGHPPLSLRIGIATGPVVAGVIGMRKFIYDLWGDTVNVASRMESSGEPGRIQVAESTYEVLRDRYRFEHRGEIPIKGKGMLSTYFLLGRV
ncbi:MAG TPA: adenylate/guanylate cyclase domain-containing protein [Pseudomonadota bacterium]|nr:adenylate/guanylate cyclase domain-containing protein [Pseudomonadota bacterium]HNN49794.1 adenylate/guanylate cyclase domain-containing protein [Pseudomonadota bacterium]